MRVTERSGSGKLLQTLFLPAEPRPVLPSEVSDEIVLTHPAIPPMVGFKESRFFFQEKTGALGVFEIVSDLVPTDRYWWIQYCEIRHNDTGSSRNLLLSIRDTVPNDVSIFSHHLSVPANILIGLERPILLPNDTQLVASVTSLGAAFTVRLRFFFYELLHAEVNPSA